jgi:RNA polymerase sigma factor (sigma-70 family)
LVQRALLRATIQRDRFRGRSIGEYYNWLAAILDKQLLKVVRRWRNQRRNLDQEEPLNPSWSDQGALAASSSSVSDRLAREEECDRLRLAASWCREEDRAVISQHLFEGHSHERIAAELEIAPAAVRQRYCRAVRRVGEAMRLLEVMSRRGLGPLQQDVLGLHRFQGADAGEIAARLRLPEELVARWIAEAKPWFCAMARDGS